MHQARTRQLPSGSQQRLEAAAKSRGFRRPLCLLTTRGSPRWRGRNLFEPGPLIVSVEAFPAFCRSLRLEPPNDIARHDRCRLRRGREGAPTASPERGIQGTRARICRPRQENRELARGAADQRGRACPGAPAFRNRSIRGHWRTRHANEDSSAFPDQASAIAAAKKLAIAKRKKGHDVKVVLQRTDGNEVVQPIDDEPGQSGGE